MKLRIKNEVLNKDLEPLRKKNARDINGNPYIHGSKLIPGAILMVHANDLSVDDVFYVEKLVNAGCLTVMIMGSSDHSLEKVKAYKNISIAEPVVEAVEEEAPPAPVLEDAAEEIEEVVEEESITHTESEEPVEAEPVSVEEEAPPKDNTVTYTKTSLGKKKNSELRAILLDIDSDLDLSNKTKRELIALILEIQNG